MVTTTNPTATKRVRKPVAKKTGTPLSYYLGLIPVVLLAFAAMIGSWWSNTPEGIALRSKEQDTKQLELQIEMAKVTQSRTPIYLASNFSGTRQADYAPTTQQGCWTRPDIGWENFSETKKFMHDGASDRCLDIKTPSDRKGVIIYLHRAPKVVRGQFIVHVQNNACNTSEVQDNCLDFIQRNTNEYLFFEGKGFFIQPAPLDKEM